ncbi:MAG: hypothetical protein SFT91_03545 [Rickettsiaceae bacterium]|nr:hypothetical protein [Rickettsiaceae bacterium]
MIYVSDQVEETFNKMGKLRKDLENLNDNTFRTSAKLLFSASLVFTLTSALTTTLEYLLSVKDIKVLVFDISSLPNALGSIAFWSVSHQLSVSLKSYEYGLRAIPTKLDSFWLQLKHTKKTCANFYRELENTIETQKDFLINHGDVEEGELTTLEKDIVIQLKFMTSLPKGFTELKEQMDQIHNSAELAQVKKYIADNPEFANINLDNWDDNFSIDINSMIMEDNQWFENDKVKIFQKHCNNILEEFKEVEESLPLMEKVYKTFPQKAGEAISHLWDAYSLLTTIVVSASITFSCLTALSYSLECVGIQTIIDLGFISFGIFNQVTFWGGFLCVVSIVSKPHKDIADLYQESNDVSLKLKYAQKVLLDSEGRVEMATQEGEEILSKISSLDTKNTECVMQCMKDLTSLKVKANQIFSMNSIPRKEFVGIAINNEGVEFIVNEEEHPQQDQNPGFEILNPAPVLNGINNIAGGNLEHLNPVRQDGAPDHPEIIPGFNFGASLMLKSAFMWDLS